jgi:hypothetical protein
MGPPPISEGGIPEKSSKSESSSVKFPSSKADGGSEERAMPAAMKAIPPNSIIIPTMMLRIAIIVTPAGCDCLICVTLDINHIIPSIPFKVSLHKTIISRKEMLFLVLNCYLAE